MKLTLTAIAIGTLVIAILAYGWATDCEGTAGYVDCSYQLDEE